MLEHQKLIVSLEAIVGRENLLVEPEALLPYALDGKTPQLAAFPGSREELSALVALCVSQGLVMVPWGGGTKMAMGNVPPRVDLVIGTARLGSIVDYDIANLSVSVESGMVLSRLQEKLAREGRGFFVPLDPPGTSSSTLGGIVAANDSGPRRFLYGTARDHILGLKFVSPTGKQVAAGGKTVKNVAGYDMTKLMIGSMGILGVISEVTFKILPLPEKQSTACLSFSDAAQASKMARKIVHSSLYPATVELLNPRAATGLGLDLPNAYLLAIALEGFTEAVERLEAEMKKMAAEAGAQQITLLEGASHDAFWTAYRDLSLNITKTCPEVLSFKANVPISKFSELASLYEQMIGGQGSAFAWTGQAGNGIIHGHLLLAGAVAGQGEFFVSLIGRLTSEAVNRGGNLLLRSCPLALKEKLDVWGMPAAGRLIMRRIKDEFDTADLMNTGRFFKAN